MMATHLFELPTGLFFVVAKGCLVNIARFSDAAAVAKIAVATMPSGATYVTFYGDKSSETFKETVNKVWSSFALDVLPVNPIFAGNAE